MSSTIDKKAPAAPAGTELAELTAKVVRWGMEAGFLGIEGHLEGRVQALVREATVRVFGNCDAERDRLVCRIEAMEQELEDSARKVEEVRAVRDSMRSRRGLLGWVLSWFAGRSELSGAQAAGRRNDPELRKARLDLEMAECTRRNAAEWREMAVQYLRVTYEYQKARAAVVRPQDARSEKEKEQTNDTRDNRQFIVHRAN
jgi:hypothetical protein